MLCRTSQQSACLRSLLAEAEGWGRGAGGAPGGMCWGSGQPMQIWPGSQLLLRLAGGPDPSPGCENVK